MKTEAYFRIKMECADGILEVALEDSTKTMQVSIQRYGEEATKISLNEDEIDELLKHVENLARV